MAAKLQSVATSTRSRWWKVGLWFFNLFLLLLAVLFVYQISENVPHAWQAAIERVGEKWWAGLPLAAGVMLSVVLRGVRAHLITEPWLPFGRWHAVRLFSYWFLAQSTLPFRAGEMARAVWAAKRGEPPLAMVGAIAVEKVQDLLAVLFMVTFFLPGDIHRARVLLLLLVSCGIYVLIWRVGPRLSEFLLAHRMAEHAWLGAPVRLLASLPRGFDAMASTGTHAGTVLFTVLAWAVTAMGYEITLGLLFPGLPASTGIAVVGAVNLASLLPVTPGNFILYEAAFAATIATQGVPLADAMAAAVLCHVLAFAAVAGLGLASRLWPEERQ
jgi:uncharacterized membrane protein YbhN (UPF0104 family)